MMSGLTVRVGWDILVVCLVLSRSWHRISLQVGPIEILIRFLSEYWCGPGILHDWLCTILIEGERRDV